MMHPALHPWPIGRIRAAAPRGSATGLMRVRRLAQVGARSCGTFPNPAQGLTGAETGGWGLDKTQFGPALFSQRRKDRDTHNVSKTQRLPLRVVIASSGLASGIRHTSGLTAS